MFQGLLSTRRFITGISLALVCLPLWGQAPTDDGTLEFSYQSDDAKAPVSVLANGNISFGEVKAGTTRTLRLGITNRGQSTWTLSESSVVGEGFTASFAGTPFAPGYATTVDLTFRPAAAGVTLAVLTVAAVDSSGVSRFLTFQLSGSAPLETLFASWSVEGGTFTPVQAGSTLQFPATRTGSKGQAVLRLRAVEGASLTLTASQVMGVGFSVPQTVRVPSALDSGGFLDLPITFEPAAGTSYSGAVNLTFGAAVVSFQIDGPGVAADLEVQSASDGATWISLSPGSAVPFPAVQAGASSSTVEFRVRNKGNGEGRVLAIGSSGAAFRLNNLPSFPVVLAAGAEFRFTAEFAPSAPGDASGTLRIDGLSFPLSGSGFEQKLGLTLLLADRRLPVAQGIAAILPNTPVGSRLDFDVEVANAGDRPASISSVSLSGQSFSFRNLPALPVTIGPGQTISLSASFIPTGVTTASATLQIDSSSYTIRGAGGPPAQLASLRISGVRSPLDPDQLIPVTAEIDAPYSTDVNGTLTVEFTPTLFVDDPSILFINGRKSIEFRIPAGSTRAQFPGNAPGTSFQSGTTAGIVTLNAQVAVGSVPVPLTTPASVSLTIPPSAPVIRSVKVSSVSSSTIDLVVAGFSTARSVTRLVFDLAGAPGGNLRTDQVVMNVADDFNSWFQSSSSRSTGGQFTTTVRLQVNGDVNAVESVSVSAANSQGTSKPVTVALR